MNPRRFSILSAVLLISALAFSATELIDLMEPADRLATSIYIGPGMTTLRELTDGYGGRLTGSAAYDKAVEWAVAKFKSEGLQDVHGEPFTIPNGWQRGSAGGTMVAPITRHLYLESLGWSPSTAPGGVTGDVVVISDITSESIKQKAGQIFGHLVYVDTEKALADGPWKVLGQIFALPQVLKNAGALAVIFPDNEANNVLNAFALTWTGTVSPLPGVQLGMEDSKLVRRLLERGPVTLQLKVTNTVSGPVQVNNVIAQIRGSEESDEWILVGGHFDSWDYGTGAQDNGSGAAMVLEAARAISALGKAPRRTIRFALWGGEEEGLLGSSAYVKAHAAEMEKCVAVLNTDNGAGHPKGWKVEGRSDLKEAMQPISDSLLKNLGGGELSLKTSYDTDHGPFLLQGVPALDLFVDMAHYGDIHHKPSDTYDKVDPLFMKADTAIVAITAYALAQEAKPIAPHINHAAVGEILKKADLADALVQIGAWKP